MRKIFVIIILALIFVISPTLAASTDFIADADITVSSVTFGASSVNFVIVEGSRAESWVYTSGAFTVVYPDATNAFTVSSSDTSVKAIRALLNGATVACVKNSAPGTNTLAIPSTDATYTIEPVTTAIANSLTYNSACGAATCDSGYTVTGSGSSAYCQAPAPAISPGGGGTGPAPDETPADETPADQTPVVDTPTETPKISETAGVPAKDSAGKVTLEQMAADAEAVVTGDVNQIIAEMGVERDAASEASYNETIVAKVVEGSGVTAEVRNTITSFVTYGTPATKVLGAGERAGVVNSFQAALGKLPTTSSDWNDVIKIANGRWPTQRSTAAEDRATVNFKKIYLREPNRTNANDDAAVTVMAYGLRPAGRNMDSEKAGIKHFKGIYGYNPEAATAWDVVRAIAYSGAIR
ncbi:MAG: hypothetical protein ABIE43_00765 [Patescibacteria group bacterium]